MSAEAGARTFPGAMHVPEAANPGGPYRSSRGSEHGGTRSSSGSGAGQQAAGTASRNPNPNPSTPVAGGGPRGPAPDVSPRFSNNNNTTNNYYGIGTEAISRVGYPGSGRLGLSGLQLGGPQEPGMSTTMHATGPVDVSGNLPMELRGQAGVGGHTTQDLGQFSKTNAEVDAMTGQVPFTQDVVTYKHGEDIILHQYTTPGRSDLLVNCQCRFPQSFIVQYGVSKGSIAWSFDISRTCDKFWFGVTTNQDLDCTGWIADHDAAYMVSEEGEVPENTYDNHVPKSNRDRPARNAMVQKAEGDSAWVRMRTFTAINMPAIWASVKFFLDMDACELKMQVTDGANNCTEKLLLFRGLPRGLKVFPCLSMCNAGQVTFRKHD